MLSSMKGLAIELSRLKVFAKADVRLEQYPTDSEVASDMLWNAWQKGDIEGRRIADLGCGTGILGIGCLFLGAAHVTFLDKDEKALSILSQNLEGFDTSTYDLIHSDISGSEIRADTVVQNPPFGMKGRHADKLFLEKAFSTAQTVYSFHNGGSGKFVSAVASDNGFRVEETFRYSFPLKGTMSFHKQRIRRIEVDCFRLRKILL